MERDDTQIGHLRLVALPGARSEQVAEQMVRSADSFGCRVVCEFNGTEMEAQPGDDASSVLNRFWRDAEAARAELARAEREDLLDRLTFAVTTVAAKSHWTYREVREAIAAILP